MKTQAKVLVIESDDSILNLMTDVLSPAYSVFCARDALDGVELLMTERVDLLILDTHLPVLSGAELVQILRAHPPFASIPIIAYRSYRGNGVSLDPAHVQAILPEVFSVDELVHTVSDTLERHNGHESSRPATEEPGWLSA